LKELGFQYLCCCYFEDCTSCSQFMPSFSCS